MEPFTHEEKTNALACALAIIRGTAGGYSPDEKRKTEIVLQQMFTDEENLAVAEMQKAQSEN